MTDDLDARLREADPATSPMFAQPSPSWVSELVEQAMNTPLSDHRRQWRVTIAAATALVLGLGGFALFQTGQDGPEPQPSVSAQPLELSMQAPGSSMESCIPFSVNVLADMPVAFAGTATQVNEGNVLLDVDQWYRGGDAQAVEISSPDQSTVALDGAVTFSAGQRYLVTATHGVVNTCGYTAEWNSQTAAAFDDAFN